MADLHRATLFEDLFRRFHFETREYVRKSKSSNVQMNFHVIEINQELGKYLNQHEMVILRNKKKYL